MKIIPVIDVMGGVVVRAVAGRRSEYRPVESRLTPSTDPEIVAEAMLRVSGSDTLYVADLDAITGQPSTLRGRPEGARSTTRLWLDAGVRGADDAVQLSSQCSAVVLGLETIERDGLPECVRRLGPERVVFSLDLKAGTPLGWGVSLDPMEVARIAHEAGVRKMIVLDLAAVGTSAGTGTEKLCSRIAESWPEVELIAGGGVRNHHDLERLADVGVNGALVASAFHSGELP